MYIYIIEPLSFDYFCLPKDLAESLKLLRIVCLLIVLDTTGQITF
jgi:hypothetical protein